MFARACVMVTETAWPTARYIKSYVYMHFLGKINTSLYDFCWPADQLTYVQSTYNI